MRHVWAADLHDIGSGLLPTTYWIDPNTSRSLELRADASRAAASSPSGRMPGPLPTADLLRDAVAAPSGAVLFLPAGAAERDARNGAGVTAATIVALAPIAAIVPVAGQTYSIPNGQSLTLDGPFPGSVTVAFAGPGPGPTGDLVLNGLSGNVTLTVSGFINCGTVELPNLTLVSAVPRQPVPGSFTQDYTFANGAVLTFTVINNGVDQQRAIGLQNGNLALVDQPCFAAGTRILTTRGLVAVESLRIGDAVLSPEGIAQAVAWLGHRRVDCARHPRPHDVWPVRVGAHAFGADCPARDVVLSPDHAVFIDGVLVPVRYLLNGASVVQEARSSVTYWHVELDRHGVLLADGLPAESYLDTGNRAAFVDAAPTLMAHPDFSRSIWAERGCAPLVMSGPPLQAARTLLRYRLGDLGWGFTDDADPTLLADGQPLRSRRHGEWLFATLPPGTQMLRLQSRRASHADSDCASEDRRVLGCAVRALLLDDVIRSLDDCRLAGGWSAFDAEDLRWTDGDAAIDVRGIRVAAISIRRSDLLYPVRTDHPTAARLAKRRMAMR